MAPPGRLAFLILNHNGRAHLGPCLDAVLALEGRPDLSDIVVADNGSSDDSADFVTRRFPGVRWLPFGANLGFAGGNNRAAEAVDADWLFFLNNDTRIRPDALAPLWQALAGGAACAGARLVSWDGRTLDFDGGGSSFTGHGHALGFGRPVPRRTAAAYPTLFASGAALLIRRAVFLDLGGFDPAYFAYYEDLDLGWRIWLAGHQVLHVPAAVVHHRHHGSAGALVSGQAARLYERNALATVVKVYDDPHLRRVLPAALALAAIRAGADQAVLEFAAPAADAWPPLPSADWPGWPRLAPLELDWPALFAARGAVQRRRKTPDSEILPRLALPLAPAPDTARMRQATMAASERFGLASLFGTANIVASPGTAARLRRLGALARAEGPTGLWHELGAYRAWRRRGQP